MKNAIEAILSAAHFAAEKHASQKRKGAAAEPYVNHLIEVAYLVSSASPEPDPNVVIAAFLHDSIEDVGVTASELEEHFGPDVASLVLEVTDDKSLPQAERKRLQIEHAPHLTARAQIIKLADKISNLRAMLYSPPADWSLQRRREYFEWGQKVVAGLTQPSEVLKVEFEAIVKKFDETLPG